MNLREAAQQALEALETEPGSFADWLRTMRAARTALRAALAEDVPETNFGNMAQTVDSKESDHVADTGKTSDQSEDARGMVATSQESRQVDPVATINKMETVERLAREAGDDWDSTLPSDKEFFARFAAIAIAAERDRMCEQFNIPKEWAHEKAKSNEAD